MTTQRSPTADVRPGPHFELLDDTICDPYQINQKPHEPSVCPNCGAVYQEGRWQFAILPVDTPRLRCPACSRIREKDPAGYVSIEGRFAKEYRNELLLLIQQTERQAKSEYPLQRVMSVADQSDGLTVTTTDIHLAQKIGVALHEAYKGNLDFHFNEAEYWLRVRWQRWA